MRRVRWTDQFRTEIGEGIVRLGLTECSVCGSSQIAISPFPFPMYRGGSPGKIEDEDTNVEFFVKLECTICGNAQFYNSARYRTGDEPIIQRGNT